MKATYKLTIDAKSCTGLLFVENKKTGAKNSPQSAEAERETAKGYIMTEARRGGFCRFDVTTILGDMMSSKNALHTFRTVLKNISPPAIILYKECLSLWGNTELLSERREKQA